MNQDIRNTKLIATTNHGSICDISIIIPSYNRPIELQRTLESLKHAKSNQYRIGFILIDNSSPNEQVELVIQDYLKSSDLDFSYYRNNFNLGWARSFNLAVELIKSDYFMFLFDDDELLPSFSNGLDSVVLENDSAIYFDHLMEYTKSSSNTRRKIRLFIESVLYPIAKKKKSMKSSSLLLTVPTFVGAIYSKKAFLILNGFDDSLGPTADYAFTIKYWKNFGVTKYKYKNIKYYHGENASSKQEIFQQFAIMNYKYRCELLENLHLNPWYYKFYLIIIKKIYEYENGSKTIANKLVYSVVFIFSKLNFL